MGTDGHGKTVNSPRESFLFSWGLLIKILKLPMDMEQLVVACFTDDKLKVINWATEALRESSLSPEFQLKNLATTCILPKDLRVGSSELEFGTQWAFGPYLAFRFVLFVPNSFFFILQLSPLLFFVLFCFFVCFCLSLNSC